MEINMAGERHLLTLAICLFSLITGVTSICPEADCGFSSCSGSTVTTQLDWTSYPESACQEWEILIPDAYTADSCTWRVALTNIPGGVTTGLTVHFLPDGTAAAADTITITFELSSVQAAAAYSGDLADLYTNTHRASISPSGEADAVEISFNSGSGAGGTAGFTMRVVAYVMDMTSTCGSASTPKNIWLTEDYPLAALATPNFPSNYPMSSQCFTFIQCPEGYHISIEYVAGNVAALEDYFLIYDSTDLASPVLLRAESNAAFTADHVESRSFVAETATLQTAFIDSGTLERSGILVVFRAVLAVVETVCAGTCDCSGTGVASDCGNPGTAFLSAAPIDNSQCGNTVTLDFTAADSQAFLATTGFDGSSQYTDDTANCAITITSPTNSELVVIFQVLDLGAEDSLIFTSGLGFDRIARLYSTESSFTFSDNTTSQTLSIIGDEIHIPANRLVVTFVNPSGTTGTGASFEVRLVDNRCGTRCVNGGFCDSCACASGYYGSRCHLAVSITDCTTTTASTINEGVSLDIRCDSDRAFTEEASVVFGLDPSSTVVQASDIGLLSEYPCVFAAGTAFCTINIPTLDDLFMELQETFTLIVDEVLGGADPNAADHTCRIEIPFTISADSDVLLVPIEFRQSIYEVNEDAGCVNVWIDFSYMGQLTPIPESGTINIAYTPDTATNPSDYMEVTTVPYVQSTTPPTSSVEFCIPIEDDLVDEDTETFTITMSVTSTLIQVGTVLTATIRIQDNDVSDNMVIIDWPNINRNSPLDINLFAFSAEDLSVWWNKPFRINPFASESSLVIDGVNRGVTVTFPRTRYQRGRRLGHFRVRFNGRSQTDVLISPDSPCLNADDCATYTVYPSVGNPNTLDTRVQLGLDPLTTCASRLIWKRNRSRLRNRPLSRTISQTAAADGVFTVSRRRGREVEGWFEIWQVIVADCPFGLCGSSCENDCSSNQCQNGGVKENDGTCTCPNCFTGEFCEIKYTDADTFGKSQRFLCSALGDSVSSRSNCMGLLFCKGGHFGCKCGCGWRGRDCQSGCDAGFYGADCKQMCNCASALCDPFTGCP